MHILVTGVTGKVGSRLVPRLLQRGHSVRTLVRQPEQAAILQQSGVSTVIGDLTQPETLVEAVRGVDAIVHLAAFFRGQDTSRIQSTNADGTTNLALAAVETGIKRFVFASTNLVYGPGRGRPAHEEDEPQPSLIYPVSKFAAEKTLLDLHQKQGLGVRILRLSFIYGESDPHIIESLPRFRTWHPAQRLTLVHHADVAQAILLTLHAEGIDGRIYNVADDAPITKAELFRLHNLAEETTDDNSAEYDVWASIVDTLKIRDELGYRPLYPTIYTARAAGVL